MKKLNTTDLDKIVAKAHDALSKSQGIMNALAYDSDFFLEEDEGDSGEGRIRLIQLVLEYRMDAQNALARLLHMNRHIMQQLGLDPLSSYDMNLDKITYALGSDDLHHLLNSLNQLINSLSLIAQRHKITTKQTLKQRGHLPVHAINPHYSKFSAQLHHAITFQKIFIALLYDIDAYLQEFKAGLTIGPILDHIASLKGPISHFFQAIQHGLEFSYALYEKISPTQSPSLELSHVINKADRLLNELIPSPPPAPQEKISPESQLELRASMKRMGQFFP